MSSDELKRRFGNYKPASPNPDLIADDDPYYVKPPADDRIVQQTSRFVPDLQCSIVTSYWRSGAVTTEYHFNETTADGYILTRIVPTPR